MSITDFEGFRTVEHGGKTYYVALEDEKHPLVVSEDKQADSDGFYECEWLLCERGKSLDVVKPDGYTVHFNPVRKEILMDEVKAAG
ncbi:MAG: hypothetical protein IJH50_00925 [Kiritimatiellae bacterium]|nr:hypothetical protein [Kiritimatiellia bacterium]